jgi:FkbM family methyltransferase
MTLSDLRSFAGSARRLGRRGRYYAVPEHRLTPMQRFVRDGGEALRWKGVSLTPQEVALDFGGFRGDYTAKLRRRFDCSVHVFEPIPAYVQELRARFRDDPKVTVHGYAVGSHTGTLEMFVEGDASGAFVSGPPVQVPVVSMETVAGRLPEHIALAKVNIEGGEFDLLPAMAASGVLARTSRLLVQFHAVTSAPDQDRDTCRQLLARDHECDWDYPWVWESWSSRGTPG